MNLDIFINPLSHSRDATSCVSASNIHSLRRKMLRLYWLIALSFVCISLSAQIQLLRQQNLRKWDMPAGNYSGITPLGGNRYAVICDKQKENGFWEWEIVQNEETGKVENVRVIAFHGNGNRSLDTEGIAFVPHTSTIFISAEDKQQISEYTLDGRRTLRSLKIPAEFSVDKIHSNNGFEALSFSDETALFWTCTENFLKAEGQLSSSKNPVPITLKLQSFDLNMQPRQQYIYTTDAPEAREKVRFSAFGVPGITALSDGNLLILERHFLTRKNYIGSYVENKIYLFSPKNGEKTLQAEWKTRLNLTKKNIANYEGMCLGRRLKDGRQTILLISDSQNRQGNALFRMKDYIKAGIIDTTITEQ